MTNPMQDKKRPFKDYKARHASTLLVFDAVERALDEALAKRDGEGDGARASAAVTSTVA